MSASDCQPETGCPPHHWLIQEPNHRWSVWTCLRCGAQHEDERPTTKLYRASGSYGYTQVKRVPKPDC
jgi:hypothetical protein